MELLGIGEFESMIESGYLGVAIILLAAFVLSEKKTAINIRTVVSLLALQAGIAAFVILTPIGEVVLSVTANGVNQIITYADEGIIFLFGDLGDPSKNFIIAFRVLPLIVFVASLVAVLYHLRIMPLFIRWIGGFLQIISGASKIESVNAAAAIFVGMVEAPLTIRPYIPKLTRSQLFAVMSTGLATVTGAILIGYAGLGISLDYLIPAAFMAAPGGLLMAKILVPETEAPLEPDPNAPPTSITEDKAANVIEAAANGAAAGLLIAVTVGAMLLAFVSLIALLNGIVGGVGALVGFPSLSLELIFGYLFAPICYIIGIPWEEAVTAGNYLGQKVILNEFIAYANLSQVADQLSDKTNAVLTFALCGFANLSGLAILLGGLGSMAPSRKPDIARLGLKVVLAGTLANLMSAALASLFLSFA